MNASEQTLTLSTPCDLERRAADVWRKTAASLLKPSHIHAELDMSNTRSLDSSGIAALLALREVVSKRGGNVRLVNPAPQVMQLLELTRMHRLFQFGFGVTQPAPESLRPILVVEDEPHIRTVCELSMKPLGRRVLSASNGQDAINIARRENPSVIILDYVMPLMDGRQTLRRLKADEATKHIPVILMSATETLAGSQHDSFEGASLFITKPFSPAALRGEVHRLIQTHLPLAA
ncbi:anti-anti-sigma factor [Prosthecobacter debontii]|uniref:Anti-anti-sigma factor n=1 Tax=Prosthecobacter debontii TaxID=48467 RepID=A0A1T4XUL9_9BACT|nr:response regulator [Prosthecobacter debontii]SKA93237.1 anti-anti-sigma factor [Prosthecobacter debontii]